MRLHNREFLAAVAAIAAFLSYGAFSDGTSDAEPVDRSAFRKQWSGQYYVEPAESRHEQFESFEARRKYFLESKEIGRAVEEFEEDEEGKWVPVQKEGPRREDEKEIGISVPQNAAEQVAPRPVPSVQPSPVPPWNFPAPWPFEYAPADGVSAPLAPEPAPVPSATPAPVRSGPPQAYYFYNSGYLRNGTQLPVEGRGFMKVFRDRDADRGGRGWGTRSMISAIETVADEFMNRFPGRERIQIADIAGKSGGHIGHGSHKNGLDADVVFIRRNGKEQLAYGGHGKNGFAEQFVVNGSATIRTYRDSRGRKRVKKSYTRKTSANFDVEANFQLLKLFDEKAEVKIFFVDDVLIRELFRYAEREGLADDPATRSMLGKLDHEPSHADHVHVRLMCQDTDASCRSANGRMPAPKKKKKSGGKKTVAKKR